MSFQTRLVAIALGALSTIAMGSACAQAPVDPHAVDLVKPGEFPAVGKSYNVDFGSQKFRLDFNSEAEMKFTSPDGKNTRIVPITVTRISPTVFMV